MRKKLSTLSAAFQPKKALLLIGLTTIHSLSYAQYNKGVGAIQQAATSFAQYLTPVQNLLYAIAAIIALIGGFTIFTKMQNGDQDVKKTILMVVGGCVAFVSMAAALPAFFK